MANWRRQVGCGELAATSCPIPGKGSFYTKQYKFLQEQHLFGY